MSIKPHFAPDIQGDSIGEKDGLNSNILELTIDKFDSESTILRKEDIFIFFDSNPSPLKNRLGITIIKDTPFYEDSLLYLPNEMKTLSGARFKIYIHREVRDSDDRIFKVFTIAHELQHVLQYLGSKISYCQAALVQTYMSIFQRLTNKLYRMVPIEIDACRKAKSIAIKLDGKEKVSSFVEQQIRNTKDGKGRSYWMNIRELDIGKSFDLQKEMQIFWDKYKGKIYLKKGELESKDTKLDAKERDFLVALSWM